MKSRKVALYMKRYLKLRRTVSLRIFKFFELNLENPEIPLHPKLFKHV